jgi:uncharacterized protein (TIGR00645 family)
MKKIEHLFEMALFNSRWLLVPFFMGLSLSILLLLFKFVAELTHMAATVMTVSASTLVIEILHLIDLTLVASLLIIILLSGYESFVSKIDLQGHEDKPAWMGKIGFSELKLKVIGSIVAISAIDLLTVFLNMGKYSEQDLFWKVTIHLTFVVSGLLFAMMDKLSHPNPST